MIVEATGKVMQVLSKNRRGQRENWKGMGEIHISYRAVGYASHFFGGFSIQLRRTRGRVP